MLLDENDTLVSVCVCVCLFVCLFVCTVTDFSVDDKASGVKFCTVVHRRPGQGITTQFGELYSPQALQLWPQHVYLTHCPNTARFATFNLFHSDCNAVIIHVRGY